MRKTSKARARENRRRVLGEQIRSLRGEMSQTELGLKMISRESGFPIPQTTVSRWEKGTVDLDLEQVFDLEEALNVKHGTLTMSAGYITAQPVDPTTIEDIIRLDPNIHPELRHDFECLYQNLLKMSKKMTLAEQTRLHQEETKPRSRSRVA